jgi:hypothetical protein
MKHLWKVISFQERSKSAHAYDDSKDDEQERDKPGKKIYYLHFTISFLGFVDFRAVSGMPDHRGRISDSSSIDRGDVEWHYWRTQKQGSAEAVSVGSKSVVIALSSIYIITQVCNICQVYKKLIFPL